MRWHVRDLPKDKLYYLGSPYSKYPAGLHEAFEEISAIAGDLLALGVSTFCPIAHSHPIAVYGGLDPLAYHIWLPLDRQMIDACDGLIVAEMETWEESHGIQQELQWFKEARKPRYRMNRDTYECTLVL